MERTFHAIKIASILTALVVAFYNPRYVTYVVAFNILVTIPFSSPTLAFGAVMLIYLLLIYVKTIRLFYAWLILYSIWNVFFCRHMNINIYSTIGANAVPLIIVLMYKTDEVNRMICVWTIIRAACLSTLYLNYPSKYLHCN
jgi:hypothetical protein